MFYKTLVLCIINDKCSSNDEKVFKEEEYQDIKKSWFT